MERLDDWLGPAQSPMRIPAAQSHPTVGPRTAMRVVRISATMLNRTVRRAPTRSSRCPKMKAPAPAEMFRAIPKTMTSEKLIPKVPIGVDAAEGEDGDQSIVVDHPGQEEAGHLPVRSHLPHRVRGSPGRRPSRSAASRAGGRWPPGPRGRWEWQKGRTTRPPGDSWPGHGSPPRCPAPGIPDCLPAPRTPAVARTMHTTPPT